MKSDLIFALRRLRQTPAFTTVAVLTLALGMSASVTVFEMLNEFMLRPLYVKDPQQLAFVLQRSPAIEIPFGFSYPYFRDMRRAVGGEDAAAGDAWADVAAYAMQPVQFGRDGKSSERVWAHEVSGNYFAMLGVQPSHGRLFLPGEGENPGADPIVVLGWEFWRSRLQADPGVVGRKVFLNGAPFTVVGVGPEKFGGAEAMVGGEVFVPATMIAQLHPTWGGLLVERSNPRYMVLGRLQPGVALATGEAAMRVVVKRIAEAFPDDNPPLEILAMPESHSRPTPQVAKHTPSAVFALMALSAFVMLVAAANVANLLFARAAASEHPLAIRSSLGATRSRLMRHLLAESCVLSVAAAVIGWVAAAWVGEALDTLTASADNPPSAVYGRDWRPVIFTLIAALGTGVVTGVFPAMRATRRDVLPLLKDASRTQSGGRHPLRSVLVVGQVALSCLVLIGAGLAVRSLQVQISANLGYRTENILLTTLSLDAHGYDGTRAETLQREVIERVRALPGVREAGLSSSVPFDRSLPLRGDFWAEGGPVPTLENPFLIAIASMDPGYLRTMGLTLAAGRLFNEHDIRGSTDVAIITRAVAEHFWPGQDPIGRQMMADGGSRKVEIIGLVEELRYFMISDRNRPIMFRPLDQAPHSDVTVALLAENEPLLLAQSVRSIVYDLDPGISLHYVRTLEEQIADSPLGLMILRLGSVMAGAQGVLVLLLSVMGLYGLVSYAVVQRTREIGVRMALGASVRDVLVLVARPSLVRAGIGIIIGLGLGYLLAMPLSGLLYGVSPHDPVVFGGVIVLIVSVTMVACLVPARRATRIDPVEALRAE